jgi:alpha/beta superfamily hydrolase
MKEARVSFLSGKLLLEGILGTPRGAGPFPAVIVCHPHPLYGGSMDNNVVNGLFEALTQASFVALKFNFRGVGESQGEFGQGTGEQEDVKGAICLVSKLKEVDRHRIGLAGYSAGAGFALPIGSDDARIKTLAAISPAFDMFDFGFLKDCHKPKLLVSGSHDKFTNTSEFFEFCRTLPDPTECEIIEGADHFWQGYESRLTSRVTDFFIKTL